MKFLFGMAIIVLAFMSCRLEQEIQMELVNVRLVNIDTMRRAENEIKVLTWLSQDHIRYTTTANIHDAYEIGTRMKVLSRR